MKERFHSNGCHVAGIYTERLSDTREFRQCSNRKGSLDKERLSIGIEERTAPHCYANKGHAQRVVSGLLKGQFTSSSTHAQSIELIIDVREFLLVEQLFIVELLLVGHILPVNVLIGHLKMRL